MGLAEVSTVLWHTRELLEQLLFKLEEEQLLLTAGRTRWLPHATREVELVLEQVRTAEVLRAAEVEAAAIELGLRPGPSLRESADAAPEPWNELLHGHREAFLALTQEISELAQANRDVLSAGQKAAQEALRSLAAEPAQTVGAGTYDPRGRTATTAGGRSHLLDEAL